MKQFLRSAVCAAAVFLLSVCPVKALAAAVSLPGGGGNTTFEIIEIEKWRSLTVTVRDKETGAPLPGVTVRLYQENSQAPITGSQETGFVTDADGTIRFRLSKDEKLRYSITIEHTGFERYQGEPFSLPNKENEQTIWLTPLYFTVRYHGGDHGSIPEGEESERVRWGAAPKQPPVVAANSNYQFSYWTLNGEKADLSQLKIKQDTDLYAWYLYLPEKPDHPQEPDPPQSQPDEPQEQSTAQPEPDSPMESTPEEIPVNPPSEPSSAQSQPPQKDAYPAVLRPDRPGPPGGIPPKLDEPGNGPGEHKEPASAPSGPEKPGGTPSSPAFSRQPDGGRPCWLHWLILLCALLTLLAGLLRLLVIHHTLERLKNPKEETENDSGGSQEEDSIGAVLTELLTGGVCVILWVVFYAIRRCHWDFWALILWGAILVILAVLLFRGERALRRAAKEREAEDSSGTSA